MFISCVLINVVMIIIKISSTLFFFVVLEKRWPFILCSLFFICLRNVWNLIIWHVRDTIKIWNFGSTSLFLLILCYYYFVIIIKIIFNSLVEHTRSDICNSHLFWPSTIPIYTTPYFHYYQCIKMHGVGSTTKLCVFFNCRFFFL